MATPDPRLQQAQQWLRQGRLAEAQALYDAVLADHPEHPAALAMSGLLAASRNDLAGAESLLRRSLVSEPRQADTHFRLGQLYLQMGRAHEALASFDAALAHGAGGAAIQHARALAARKLGRLGDAVEGYGAVLAIAPDHFEALCNRSGALRLLGRMAEAEADARRARGLRPQSPEAANALGMALHGLGRFEDALASYREALQWRPDHAETLNNVGMALHALGRLGEAETAYAESLRRDPQSPQTLSNLGVALYEQRRPEQALQRLDAALAADPGLWDARLNRANVLAALDRNGQAEEAFDALLAERPHDAEARMNRANLLRDDHRFDAALRDYADALAAGADAAAVRFNRSLCLLTMGNYADGWADHEARWQARGLGLVQPRLGVPLWLGREDLRGRRILLHAEQGLGDTLQMCRYAAAVAALGAQVVLQVQAPLVPLLQGLAGAARVIPAGSDPGPVDCHCPLMSLPLALGTRLDTIPAPPACLHTDPALVAHWASRIVQPGRLQVGLAWAGNRHHANDRRRSLPLGTLLPALPPGPRYWMLQKDVPADDQAAWEADGRIERFEATDFANTAAQIRSLDLVLSVDTSIAHLAGTLGAPTWIVLARTADWRWLTGREDSPWYPSARLFRQEAAGDWSLPLARVRAGLQALAGG